MANIPVGTARNGHFELGVAAPVGLTSVELTRASGALDGVGLQVHWLRPIPPIDNGQAQLRIVDPDTLDIIVTGGRQRLRNQKETSPAGLQIRGGKVRITGIMQPRQVGVIEADIAGPVPDALALLREPRLSLLSRHPIDLKNPAGQTTVKCNITVPLEDAVRMDDIAIQVQARLDGVHLGALVAGHDLDQGAFDLSANTQGMKLSGRALLASIQAKLDATMDFRAGPPTQVLQSVTVSAQPDARQLAALGLDATSVLSGAAQVQAALSERRNGQGDLTVTADLTAAELVVEPIEWRKARDAPAKGSARVLLDHDRLTGIDAIQLDGEGLVLRGRAEFSGGRLSVFRAERLMLGRTAAQGTLNLPADGPIVANLSGAQLDLGPRLERKAPPARSSGPGPAAKTEPPPGPPWRLDAKFDRVLMTQGRAANGVVAHVENDGRIVRQLRLEGRLGQRAPFLVQIVPDRTGRRFTASADDAGELLRELDYLRSMQGGKLSIQAQYDDAQPDRPLAGTADIEGFRIHDAPALGKLLQAMTLYGLVDVMRGPGLGFSRLVAPFRLTDDALDLHGCARIQPVARAHHEGSAGSECGEGRHAGDDRAGIFLQLVVGQHPTGGKAVQPGTRRRRVRRQLHAARPACGPGRVHQSARRTHAGVPARAVRTVLRVGRRAMTVRNDIVDVLIIGSGASGAAVAWSLAETRMKILCLEQGDWMKPTDFPSHGRDWEARRFADFDISPNRAGATDRLPDQRRQLADEGRQFQRRRRRHDPVHRALPADAPVGFPRAHARRRRRRLADRLCDAGAVLCRERPHDGRIGPRRRSRLSATANRRCRRCRSAGPACATPAR